MEDFDFRKYLKKFRAQNIGFWKHRYYEELKIQERLILDEDIKQFAILFSNLKGELSDFHLLRPSSSFNDNLETLEKFVAEFNLKWETSLDDRQSHITTCIREDRMYGYILRRYEQLAFWYQL